MQEMREKVIQGQEKNMQLVRIREFFKIKKIFLAEKEEKIHKKVSRQKIYI